MLELSYWHWFALGILIMLADAFGTAGFLIAIGSAAISMGLLCFILTIDLFWQLFVFALFCMVYALLWWQFFQYQEHKHQSTLNRPLEALLGQTAVLSEDIRYGRGKIYFNDAYWVVYGPALTKGATVRIARIEQDKIFVEPMP